MTNRELDWNKDESWGLSLNQDLILTDQMFEDTHYSTARERIKKGISPASLLQQKRVFHQQRIQEITAKWRAK